MKSQKTALTAFAVIAGLFIAWKFAFGSPAKSPRPIRSEATQETTAPGSRPQLPDGPRLAVLKGSHGFNDRAAATEFSKEYDRIFKFKSDEFNQALDALNSRLLKEKRGFTFSRDCVVRLSKTPPIGNVHEVFVEDAEDNEAAAIWVEEKNLLDSTTIAGSRVLNGFSVLRGEEAAELDGVLVADLRGLLQGLYDGEISPESAKTCVFTPQTQCLPRIEVTKKTFVVCGMAGGGPLKFVIRRTGDEDPLSNKSIRYVGQESFTTRNGTVRMVPVFQSVPDIKTEPVFDRDKGLEAEKPNQGTPLPVDPVKAESEEWE